MSSAAHGPAREAECPPTCVRAAKAVGGSSGSQASAGGDGASDSDSSDDRSYIDVITAADEWCELDGAGTSSGGSPALPCNRRSRRYGTIAQAIEHEERRRLHKKNSVVANKFMRLQPLVGVLMFFAVNMRVISCVYILGMEPKKRRCLAYPTVW